MNVHPYKVKTRAVTPFPEEDHVPLYCAMCLHTLTHGDHLRLVQVNGRLALMHDNCVRW